MKIPLALAKAAEASLPTLVEVGKVYLRIRLTHASGGSNSIADGGPLDDEAAAAGLPCSSRWPPTAAEVDAGLIVRIESQEESFDCYGTVLRY